MVKNCYFKKKVYLRYDLYGNMLSLYVLYYCFRNGKLDL